MLLLFIVHITVHLLVDPKQLQILLMSTCCFSVFLCLAQNVPHRDIHISDFFQC